jgi:sucrose-6-phosphate hydrolase SacC (GH32 family)
MKLHLSAKCLLLALVGCCHAQTVDTNKPLLEVGEFKLIYNPSVGEKQPWYINDHCFIYDRTGKWHLFGITREEPASPADEDNFAHATSVNLLTNWLKQPFALRVDSKAGEAHLWAPHVIEHEGLYYMYYCAGGKNGSEYQIKLATSKDLFDWQRHPANPMLIDGIDARDPFILRATNQWLMYYTATSKPQGGNHVVFVVESKDLIHWGNKKTAFLDPEVGTWGGPTESPFVVRRGKTYYLFIGPRNGYRGTCVYRSDNPREFKIENLAAKINSHAAEVVRDSRGNWFVSHAGWGQGGVYLAALRWHDGVNDEDTSMPIPRKN